MSPHSYKEEDIRTLGAEWNVNVIRWQMVTKWGAEYKYAIDYDLNKYEAWLEEKLIELDKVLATCRTYGILVVIDLHSPPGGRRSNKDLVLTHEKKYFYEFLSVWQKIARRYKGNPAVWGYDLVNEPVQKKITPGQPDYLEAQALVAKAIRDIDPEVPIIIEPAHWAGPKGFIDLQPINLPNLIYEVHMYYPHSVTHQGMNGNKRKIKYPGIVNCKTINKMSLKKYLEPVREFQKTHNVHIYVGEFSAVRWAPGDSAFLYLKDCIDIFEEYGWDWTYHSFRASNCWSVEHGGDANIHSTAPSSTKREKLLRGWFAMNQKPTFNIKK
jgi:aryl-phospho-beta-D-glucosidase BglC (GH1 family)